MSVDLQKIKQPFFIGIAGAGMSAIAQYLQGTGMQVSGSDRFFNEGKAADIKTKLHLVDQMTKVFNCVFIKADWLTSSQDIPFHSPPQKKKRI